MTLSEQRKLSNHICRLLKVSEITWNLARTSKGNLGITFNTNNEDFTIMLDSIPLSTKDSLNDENNIELKKMVEKYYFSPDSQAQMYVARATERLYPGDLVKEVPPAKKRGRPAKNGEKTK